MIIPVRCMSCGKPIGGLWKKYSDRIDKGESPAKVMDDLGIKKYCCRAIFLTHADNVSKVGKFRF